MTEANNNLPGRVSFGDKDVKRFASDDKLRAGTKENPAWYRVIVTKQTKAVGKEGTKTEGCLQVALTLSPLKDPQDANSVDKRFTVYERITLPLSNPDIEGHRAPKWAASVANERLSAFAPEIVPGAPRYRNKQVIFEGNVLNTKQEKQEAEETAINATLSAASALWNEELDLKGHVAYVKLIAGEYTNFSGFCSELPEGAVLTPPEQFLDEG